MVERKMIYLCLAHMSEDGMEQKYVKEAFDTNWVVPMGPNVNEFEKRLEEFVNIDSDTDIDINTDTDINTNADTDTNTDADTNTNTNADTNTDTDADINTNINADADTDTDINTDADINTDTKHKLDREVVCLASGTSAVHLALIACGVKPGDEVLVQSFTFCASSHPITYLGAKPVFVGSEGETWNIDPQLLEAAIIDRKAKTGKYPKAIVPVALYGMPYRIDEIMAIAEKYGIPVIEDAAEGMGSRYKGQVLGTFGEYGVLSFNGNKMITTSGGGALICRNQKAANEIMWYATQARDAYPYYQHTAIGYNYRMSNVCAGIGRGQMTVLEKHIEHHKHVQAMYEELLKDVPGVHMHKQPDVRCKREDGREVPVFDANFWLCAATIDPNVKVKGQEQAYKEVVKTAVGGAAGVIHAVDKPTTDCQPNDNVEALRVFMLEQKIECRPLWKPMHKQPVYKDAAVYTNGIEEDLFKVGFCLPAGPYVSDDDVRYIVNTLKSAIED